MDPLLLSLVLAVAGLVLGWLVGTLRTGAAARANAERNANERVELQRELAAADAQSDALREQLEQNREQQRADRARSEQESKVLQALSPVQETLRAMQLKVAELEQQRSQQYGSIAEQLQATRAAGEQIRSTAETLASALRNNSTRGAWGEAQLRNIAEAAGLTNRVDFELQSTLTTDSGRGRPDMTVHLPGGKSIAIDAKVPFDAYLEASAIPASAESAEQARRNSLLLAHSKKLRGHINALAGRGYWAGLDASPEFVIAFVPSESLLSAALEADPSLLDYSFRKGVALASPVSFLAVLKAVAFTWQQDLLTEDAKKLFDLSRTLYQRLSVLGDHSEALRRSIERTVETYNKFASSLESRVLVTARQLNALDESKVLGTAELVTQSPQGLSAPELTGGEPAHTEQAATQAKDSEKT